MVAQVAMSKHVRRKPTFVSRLKVGRKPGMAVATGAFTLSATAVGVAGITGITLFLGLAAAATIVGVGTAYMAGRGEILPKNLVDEVKNREAPYTCAFCTRKTLAEACDLTKPHYRDEYVSGTQAEAWRQKNPNAFVHIMNAESELVASFGVLALSPGFTDQFLKGNVTDLLLKAGDVLTADEAKRAPRLYISGVVVSEPASHLGRKRATAMLSAMAHYLEKVYGARKKRTLYAIAVTKESERLMQNLGFELMGEGKDRQDHHDLYCFELTPASWKTLKERVGVFGATSSACKYEF